MFEIGTCRAGLSDLTMRIGWLRSKAKQMHEKDEVGYFYHGNNLILHHIYCCAERPSTAATAECSMEA